MSANSLHTIVVQIATPYLTGTGFCLNAEGIIVTNEHIVRDSKTVVVDHPSQGKQLGKVLYLDPKRDLAILQVPKPYDVPTIKLQQDLQSALDQKAVALAFRMNDFEKQIQGVIIALEFDVDGIPYLQHNAILTGSDSGGPLLGNENVLLGINTFISRDGEMIGLALPVRFLEEALMQLEVGNGKTACRCYNCGTTVYEDNPQKEICPTCSDGIQIPALIPAYEPVGVAATIESLLSETVDEIALSRKGPSYWQVQHGSAEINISYYEKNGLIVGDAHLCALPPTDNKELFLYLLKQNFEIENLTFSIRNGDIVLSLMIYDRYLNESTGRTLFQYLFQQADDFDNILVEQYGAVWKKV